MFKDINIQDRLDAFVDYIKLNRISEQEKSAKEELDELLAKKEGSFSRFYRMFFLSILMIVLFAVIYIVGDFYFGRSLKDSPFLIVMLATIAIIPTYTLFASNMLERLRQTTSISEARHEISRIREEKLSLMNKMEEAKKTQGSK